MGKRGISKFNMLTRTQKVFTVINYITSIAFCLFLIGYVIYICATGNNSGRLVSCLATSMCYLLPFLIQWIFRFRIPVSLYFIYLIFLTFAGFCGSCFGVYSDIPNMDKVSHFIWGYVACIISIFVLCKSKSMEKLKPFMIIIFFVGISMATASFWELIEFFSDNVLGQTAQGSPVNGVVPVTDTMLDILCHLGGTIIFTIHYLMEKLFHKNLGITAIIKDFECEY